MLDIPIYISKDIDRILFTGIFTAIVFYSIDIGIYCILKLVGNNPDWRPAGYDAANAIANHPVCIEICCRRRTVYEAGTPENSEPEDEIER